MLARFAGFELRYQLFSPAAIVIGLIFFLFTFASVTIPQVQIGSGGAININSPTAVSLTVLIMSLFGLFVPTVFLGSVVLRDKHFATEGLFYTKPISKFDYLAGRFIGAFAVVMLVFATVPLAIFVGSQMPWLDSESIGPVRLQDYAYVLGVLAFPNLLITGAIMFTVANFTRSNMAMYTAALAVLILYITGSALTDDPELRTLAAIFDPFGINAFGEVTRYWPPFEHNTRLVPLEGVFLWNRVLWLGVSAVLLAVNVVTFSFRARGVSGLRAKSNANDVAQAAPTVTVALPTVTPQFGAGVALAQFVARLRFELMGMVKSVTFWAVLVFGIFMSLVGLLNPGLFFGTPVYPVSRVMITIVQGQFAIVPMIILIYFASELVWRDRVLRAHEIIDATPTPSWAFVFSKLFAMWTMLLSLFVVAMLTAIAVQLLKGSTEVEVGLYLRRMLFQDAIGFYLVATLSIFVQVATNNRFIGMLTMVGYLIATIVLANVGFQHNLYLFGGGPGAPMSDMNGDGHFIIGTNWFNFYWLQFSGILVMLTFLLWNRGALTPIWRRLAALPSRVSPVAGAALAVLTLGFAATGSFIFYNTNVLNTYMTTKDVERRAVQIGRAHV